MADVFIGCNVFEAIPAQCKTGIGGIKNVYLTAFSGFSYSSSTITGSTGGVVTGITTGATTLYEVYPTRASASVSEDQKMDNTNTVYVQTLTLKFVDDVTMRNFVASLAKSIVVAIVEYRQFSIEAGQYNNTYKMYGSDNGLQVATNHNSGTAEADHNEYTIVLTATEAYNAPLVQASAIAAYTIW